MLPILLFGENTYFWILHYIPLGIAISMGNKEWYSTKQRNCACLFNVPMSKTRDEFPHENNLMCR